jgi:hypothetical protein
MFARRKSVLAGALVVVTDGLHAATNTIAAMAVFRIELMVSDREEEFLTRMSTTK